MRGALPRVVRPAPQSHAPRPTRYVQSSPRLRPRSRIDMHRLARFASALSLATLVAAPLAAQAPARQYTHADTLRGSDGPARAWWDVEFYDLHIDRLAAGQQRPRLQHHHLPRAAPVGRHADRPAGAAGSRQHRAGRAKARVAPRRQRVLRVARQRAAARHRSARSPSTTTESRAPRRNRPGTAASSGRPTASATAGSRPPTRDSAPASGGPTRTTSATSRTASASPSPSPTR